jgi:hypothetical protein
VVCLGDVGVAVGVDEAVVVEGGRALVAGGSVDGCVVSLAAVGMVNKWHHFFVWERKCDQWSVRSPTVYKPLLFVFFCPRLFLI